MIRISAVSYLNTKPFIYGIYRSALGDQIELSLDIPSECARKLLVGEADLALTPVAIIPELPQAHLISDFCIGSTGVVKTVCLFSEKPLHEIKRIYLDFHSRTSVMLTRLLCAEYWNIQPEFIPATEGFENLIQGDAAALIIGDRTIGLDNRYPYIYDLGSAWTAWTGLPFVFAAWVSVKPLDPEFITIFNAALQTGLDHLPELIKILATIPGFDVEAYFRNNISYDLDDAKWQGLNKFLTHLAGEKG
ncbi:MAG: menaquinone biosynthesis protein, partial [Bacteroidota bacterium]